MLLKELIRELEVLAPPSYQENYDNSGLIIGDAGKEINNALICVDVNQEVVEEAIRKNIDVIISHHPIVFGGLKKLTGRNYVERVVIDSIKNDIAIYSIHTNLDNVLNGTNSVLAKKLELESIKVLNPQSGLLRKLVCFCPVDKAAEVRKAIFEAGAGHIGNYDSCSFNARGQGSFRAGEDTNPYVGEKNTIHFEDELRIETIYPKHLEGNIINAMLKAHPYEEVAYDLYSLENKSNNVGSGVIGKLKTSEEPMEFLQRLKAITDSGCIRHTKLPDRKIKSVAICGGSGAFLIGRAKSAGADVYISGDIKYHEFFDAEEKMVIADIGHYESEQFTKELLINYILEKFPTFAVQISDLNTNPINYL